MTWLWPSLLCLQGARPPWQTRAPAGQVTCEAPRTGQDPQLRL